MIKFLNYTSKPIVRQAFVIKEDDRLSFNNVKKKCLLTRGRHSIRFDYNNRPTAGDYVCRIDDNDIYHIPREVFLERNNPIPKGGFAP